jgi:hypothetical protein
LLVLALLLLFAVVIRAGCGDLCGEDVQGELKAEDGRHEARVVVRSCGATTDFVTVVQVGVGGEYQDALSVAGQGKVLLEWRDSGRTLEVVLPPGYQSRTGASPTSEVNGVRVVVE